MLLKSSQGWRGMVGAFGSILTRTRIWVFMMLQLLRFNCEYLVSSLFDSDSQAHARDLVGIIQWSLLAGTSNDDGKVFFTPLSTVFEFNHVDAGDTQC